MKLQFKNWFKRLILGVSLVVSAVNWANSSAVAQPAWSWCYGKKLTADQAQQFADKSELIFSKTNLAQFTQLIFSFNAHRPTQGYFRFSVQGHTTSPNSSNAKQWSDWHKMIDWGAHVQRSHRVQHDPKFSYEHVRFEAKQGHYFDGFRIKISAHNGASLADLRHIGVCVSNLNLFKAESAQVGDRLPTVKILNVPLQSQMSLDHKDGERACSPTATSMQVAYLAKTEPDTLKFLTKSYDMGLETYGSWPFSVARAYEIYPLATYRVLRLRNFADLHAYLKARLPVVVSVRGPIYGAPKPYSSGHLMLVTGWDRQNKLVLVNDPAMPCNRKVARSYRLRDFLPAWEKSRRLAYVAELD
jgi:hypothetical protein